MRGFPGVVATQHGLPYADLWLWIIRTCNLLVLDSFAYKLSLPTRCKRKLGKKNPFDDVTRRPILELLCWQRIMRAGLTSVIVCSAIVNTPAKWWKPGHKYSRQLRLKLSFPHIYLCQQMRGCNFKCCHTGDLSPDTRNVFSSLLQQGHIFSRLPDFQMFLWLDVFLFFSGKLELRLLGCEDLLKPLATLEEENLTEDSSSFAAHKAEEPPGKGRFRPHGPNVDSF